MTDLSIIHIYIFIYIYIYMYIIYDYIYDYIYVCVLALKRNVICDPWHFAPRVPRTAISFSIWYTPWKLDEWILKMIGLGKGIAILSFFFGGYSKLNFTGVVFRKNNPPGSCQIIFCEKAPLPPSWSVPWQRLQWSIITFLISIMSIKHDDPWRVVLWSPISYEN